MSEKAKYWSTILYPENMIEGWQDNISEILQIPYAYCVHDRDVDQDGAIRKAHVHIIVAFNNTTTYKHAFTVLCGLNKPNNSSTWSPAFNVLKQVISIRHMYNYLIHDTDDCRKKGKFLYGLTDRVCGNNFDIGAYEQISLRDKQMMLRELCDLVVERNFTNYRDVYVYISQNFSIEYFEVMASYSGMLERIAKGNFLKSVN